MPRRWGPEHEGCHYIAQMRLYYRVSEGGVQRFKPYGWLCRSCGRITFDEDVEFDYLPEDIRRELRREGVATLGDLGKRKAEILAKFNIEQKWRKDNR